MSRKIYEHPAFEAGDPNQFAVRVEFVPNLVPGFATPEEDLSWGRLQVWAGGRNLCEHLDRGEVRKAVEWYLLPALEWFAEAWDFLLHEQRPPVSIPVRLLGNRWRKQIALNGSIGSGTRR